MYSGERGTEGEEATFSHKLRVLVVSHSAPAADGRSGGIVF